MALIFYCLMLLITIIVGALMKIFYKVSRRKYVSICLVIGFYLYQIINYTGGL